MEVDNDDGGGIGDEIPDDSTNTPIKEGEDYSGSKPSNGPSNSPASIDKTIINSDYESIDYGEIYGEYYDKIMYELSKSDLTPEQRAFYENYFETLKK